MKSHHKSPETAPLWNDIDVSGLHFREADIWTPPIACGMDITDDVTSLVVIDPGTQSVATGREFCGTFDGAQVEDYLLQISDRFLQTLCCAVDWSAFPRVAREHIPCGPWFWVRYYTDTQLRHYNAAMHAARRGRDDLGIPRPFTQVKATALALQLQDDLADLEGFRREHHYLAGVQASIRRLHSILTSRFPADLQEVARAHHGLKF